MFPPDKDKRRHQRKISVTPFAYSAAPEFQVMQFGVTANISDSGACIYSDFGCREGEIIEIRSTLPAPYARAEVKWARRDAADFYMMGLMFIE